MALADMASLDDLATATITPANVPSLAPAGTANFTATYLITQADIDAGHVFNSAVASGTSPDTSIVNANATFDTPIPQVPAIAAVKSGTINLGADSVASVGDVITYAFTVSNPGNTTLSNVTVADPLPGIVLTGSPVASLAPGASNATAYSATYVLTQADVDAGKVENQATASGKPPGVASPPVTDLSDPTSPTGNLKTVITLTPQPKIALVKKVGSVQDVNGNGRTDLGDIVHYTFDVKNTGNVTLNNVYVQDRNPAAIESPAPPTGVTILPNTVDTTTFTATYTLALIQMEPSSPMRLTRLSSRQRHQRTSSFRKWAKLPSSKPRRPLMMSTATA
jgi:large repetitive protein